MRFVIMSAVALVGMASSALAIGNDRDYDDRPGAYCRGAYCVQDNLPMGDGNRGQERDLNDVSHSGVVGGIDDDDEDDIDDELENEFDEAGDEIEDTADDVGDEIEDSADDVGDEIEDEFD